jgi:hypothetical protein
MWIRCTAIVCQVVSTSPVSKPMMRCTCAVQLASAPPAEAQGLRSCSTACRQTSLTYNTGYMGRACSQPMTGLAQCWCLRLPWQACLPSRAARQTATAQLRSRLCATLSALTSGRLHNWSCYMPVLWPCCLPTCLKFPTHGTNSTASAYMRDCAIYHNISCCCLLDPRGLPHRTCICTAMYPLLLCRLFMLLLWVRQP